MWERLPLGGQALEWHWGWGSAERKATSPRAKRPRQRCLLPPGSDPGRDTEKAGSKHLWAQERWGQNLRSRGKKGQKQTVPVDWYKLKDSPGGGTAVFPEHEQPD